MYTKSEFVTKHRKALGLSQQGYGRNYEVTQGYVSLVELGLRPATIQMASDVVLMFWGDVSLADLNKKLVGLEPSRSAAA